MSTRVWFVRLAVVTVLATTPMVARVPAGACTSGSDPACGGQVVAVNLGAGSLTLSAPASVTITGTLGAASSFSQQMTTMEIQDGRGTLAGWSLTALTTGNLTTSGSPSHTISLGTSSVGGPLTMTTGTITPVGISSLVNVSAGAGGSLNPSQPIQVASAALGFGGGTYDFTPTVRLTPPPNTFAGSYSTTITFTLSG